MKEKQTSSPGIPGDFHYTEGYLTKRIYGYFLKSSEPCKNRDSQGKHRKARMNKKIRICLFGIVDY